MLRPLPDILPGSSLSPCQSCGRLPLNQVPCFLVPQSWWVVDRWKVHEAKYRADCPSCMVCQSRVFCFAISTTRSERGRKVTVLGRVRRCRIRTAMVHGRWFIFCDHSTPPLDRVTYVITKIVPGKQSRQDHPLVFCGVNVVGSA